MNGRMPEQVYTIGSPCEPNDLGVLIKLLSSES